MGLKIDYNPQSLYYTIQTGKKEENIDKNFLGIINYFLDSNEKYSIGDVEFSIRISGRERLTIEKLVKRLN